MAAGELGCHSATISPQVLNKLAKLPYDVAKQPGEGILKQSHPYQNAAPTPAPLAWLSRVDPLSGADWDSKVAGTDVDYLANQGAELEKAIKADLSTKQRLRDALELFIGAEKKSQAKVEEAILQV